MAVPPSPPTDTAARRRAPSRAAFSEAKLIDAREVCRRTGFGRSTIEKLTAENRGFPQKIKLSAKIVRWSAEAVDQWIADRIASAGSRR